MDPSAAGSLLARIDALWDDLAEFDAARHDEALTYLLRALCELVGGARNATWVSAVRLPDLVPGDPLHGWRPRVVRFLHPSEALDDTVREQIARIENQVDICISQNVALAGRLRVNRLVDMVPAEWFESEYYRTFYLGFGNADALWAGCPVNADAEVYFGLLRGNAEPPFTRADCDTFINALRGLKWFHRQYMLSHGLLVASAPLTPVEREVLQGLLAGKTEKEIAMMQDRGIHTVHEYVKALYRKFGVKSRASLMALWLGSIA